jgi:hypothetical protein
MLLDITDALIAAKAPQANRKQAIDIQAATHPNPRRSGLPRPADGALLGHGY